MNLLPHSNRFGKAIRQTGRRTRGLHGWIWQAVLALGAANASAAVHPVPLEPNTDSKNCIECHEEKTKGKSIHSAMSTGCLSCHEVRVNKDITRVKLITATPSGLCITCHADKKAANIREEYIPRRFATG